MRLLLDTHTFLWFVFGDPSLSALARMATLPFHHRDPFDRMLVSQCLAEGMPLISVDAKLDPYGIHRLW